MKTIYKYRVPITDEFELLIPKDARVLTVQMQERFPYIWALVDTYNKDQSRTFYIVGTGNPVPSVECVYVGTFQVPPFVWHLFERMLP
jgi:hypothetical protein